MSKKGSYDLFTLPLHLFSFFFTFPPLLLCNYSLCAETDYKLQE